MSVKDISHGQAIKKSFVRITGKRKLRFRLSLYIDVCFLWKKGCFLLILYVLFCFICFCGIFERVWSLSFLLSFALVRNAAHLFLVGSVSNNGHK